MLVHTHTHEHAHAHTQYGDVFLQLVSAAKGSDNAKFLAASIIPRHTRFFPAHLDAAIDAQFDLCEDIDK